MGRANKQQHRDQILKTLFLSAGLTAIYSVSYAYPADEVRMPVVGSEPSQSSTILASHLGKAESAQEVSVNLVLRRANAEEFENLMDALKSGNPLVHAISREEMAARYGADPGDIALIQEFAASHELRVTKINQATRTVVVSGRVDKINSAFGVELHNFNLGNGAFHSHSGQVQLPMNISSVVESVVGLDSSKHYGTHIRKASTQATSFSPVQIAQFYNFPKGRADGQCIGLIELGGGYTAQDLQMFFSDNKMPTPQVTSISVDGALNEPGKNINADGEVELDIEVAGAVAPGAKIVVYFAPNTDQGFLDAMQEAIHDSTNHCSTVSISWGGPESASSPSSVHAQNDALKTAAAVGVTVTSASGDGGAKDGTSSLVSDFPSSSPFVVGCGGTNLSVQGNSISETVWFRVGINPQTGQKLTEGSGGGVSKLFPVPSYQNGLEATPLNRSAMPLQGRGVPDVSGVGDPNSGYNVVSAGKRTAVGGTSAVAPLYAGLFSLINAHRRAPIGFANPVLYSHPQAFNVIATGHNGGYRATSSGWSAATGLGSPNGTAIQSAFGN